MDLDSSVNLDVVHLERVFTIIFNLDGDLLVRNPFISLGTVECRVSIKHPGVRVFLGHDIGVSPLVDHEMVDVSVYFLERSLPGRFDVDTVLVDDTLGNLHRKMVDSQVDLSTLGSWE